jgi:hypothetical protein
MGVAAGVLALLYAGNLTLALLGCPGRLPGNCTGTITLAERTTLYYTTTSWDQICFDDFAITIAWAVIGYATVVLDMVAIIYQLSLRETTLREFGRRATIDEIAPKLKQQVVLHAPDGRRLEFIALGDIIQPSDNAIVI